LKRIAFGLLSLFYVYNAYADTGASAGRPSVYDEGKFVTRPSSYNFVGSGVAVTTPTNSLGVLVTISGANTSNYALLNATQTFSGGNTFENIIAAYGGVNSSSQVFVVQTVGSVGIDLYFSGGTSSDRALFRLGTPGSSRGGEILFNTSAGTQAIVGFTDNGPTGDGKPTKGFYIDLMGSNRFYISKAGLVGINTAVPTFLLHVSSPAGTIGPLMSVATGTSNLFETTSSSATFNIPVYFKGHAACDSVDLDADGQLICGTDDSGGGAGGALNFSSAGTLIAISTLIPGGGLEKFTTLTGTGVITVDTGTLVGYVNSTGVALTNLKAAFDLFLATGEPLIQGWNLFQATGPAKIERSDLFRSTAEARISNTTDTYVGWLHQVAFSSTVISTPGTNGYGCILWSNNDSTGTPAIYEFLLASGAQNGDPQIYLTSDSTGVHPNSIRLNVAIGTPAANGTDYLSVIWKSTLAVTLSSQTAGIAGRMQQSSVVEFDGAGVQADNSRVIYVKVWPWTNNGSGQKIGRPPVLAWKRTT